MAPRLVLILLLMGTAHAWPEGSYNPYEDGPISVNIDPIAPDETDYLVNVRNAMAWWEAGGNGRLNWTVDFVEVQGPAEIHVSFNRSGDLRCDDDVPAAGCGGYGGPERPGTVVLGLRTCSYRVEEWGECPTTKATPYATLEVVAKHEFGHALGFDHALDPSDIMHPGWEQPIQDERSPDTDWAMKWGAWTFGMIAVALGVRYVLRTRF